MRALAAGLVVALVVVGAWARTDADTPVLRGVVRVNRRPAKDVVVWLERRGPIAPTTGRVVLDQRNMMFVPRLLVVTVGTTVEMPNSDRVFHNVFSFHNGKRFDLGLYPAGTRKLVTFDQPGVSRVFCNIHPAMAAYVVAVDSNRYAVTDAEGRFAIAGVEGDRHAFSMWRAGAEPYSGTIAGGADLPVSVDWP